MTKVKICGITNLEDARLAVECGADAIGFNFFQGSKRYVDEGCAKSIVERLQSPVLKVGVFVDQSIEEIIDIEEIVWLDAIQLHGEESSDFINALRKQSQAKIIKAFRVGPEFDTEMLGTYAVDAIMLDSYSASEHGGTGQIFDWNTASHVASIIDHVYLAGGLNPDNVAEAIRTVKPFAVDVASGVESSPRKKDANKMEAFMRNAKGA
jgi:phosphoribosylanthranilate isomerase